MLKLHKNAKFLRLYHPIFLLALFLYIVIMLPVNVFLRRYAPEEMASFEFLNTVIFGIFAAYYGYSRVLNFHPIFNSAYLMYLALSPWEFGKPLPRGPIHLVWTDFVMIGCLMLLTLLLPVDDVWILPAAFLGGYVLTLFWAFVLAKQTQFYIVYLFLAPFCVFPHSDVHIAVLVLLGLLILGSCGVTCYLRNFPWNSFWWNFNMIDYLKRNALQRRVIQWPFKELMTEPQDKLSYTSALVITLLVFWWIYVIEWIIPKENSLLLVLYPFAIILMAILRCLIYLSRCRTPIGLFGRIFTGRLIIPGYDRVFLTPIVIILIGVLSPILLHYTGTSFTLAAQLSFAAALFAAMTLGPSLENWHYTGQHRIGTPPRPSVRPVRKRT